MPYATPRTRRTLPVSMTLIGSSCRNGDSSNVTSPPPFGGAPRLAIDSAAPSMPKWRSSGSVTVRRTSTLTSSEPFVTPFSVTRSARDGARTSKGCTK